MGDTVNDIMIRDIATGQVKTLYTFNEASAAIGTTLPCDMSQVATANSSKDWRPATNYELKDFIAGAATGRVQVIKNGLPAGFYVNFAGQQAGNAGRCIPLGFQFEKGATYNFRVENAALPA